MLVHTGNTWEKPVVAGINSLRDLRSSVVSHLRFSTLILDEVIRYSSMILV